MTLPHDADATVGEALLVQYLHGELDAHASNELSGHLAQCDACRILADSLEQSARRASEALLASRYDEPDPREWQAVLDAIRTAAIARRRATHLRIAAGWIIAIAAIASLASAPVRAWITERWASIIDNETIAEQSPTPPERPGTVALSFEPEGPNLEIAFETTQSAGTLTVRFSDATTVSVAVSGGAEEQLGWRQSGIQIANAPGSAASYQLTLARAVQRVSVRIGSHEPIDLLRTETGDAAVEIGLHNGRVRNPASRDED
jgi:hypothetical protein